MSIVPRRGRIKLTRAYRHCGTTWFGVDADFKLWHSFFRARGPDFCSSDGLGFYEKEGMFQKYLKDVGEIKEAGAEIDLDG